MRAKDLFARWKILYFHKHTRIQTMSSLHFYAPSVRSVPSGEVPTDGSFFSSPLFWAHAFSIHPPFFPIVVRCGNVCAHLYMVGGFPLTTVVLSFIVNSFHFCLAVFTFGSIRSFEALAASVQFETDGNECGFLLCSCFEICLHSFVYCVCFCRVIWNCKLTLRGPFTQKKTKTNVLIIEKEILNPKPISF